MFEKLFQDTTASDSVSYVLRNREIQHVDTLSLNLSTGDFMSFDSIEPIFTTNTLTSLNTPHVVGYEGDIHYFSPLLTTLFFLILLVCFVLFSFIFHRKKILLFKNGTNIFKFIATNRLLYNKQSVVMKTWSEVFLILQTIIVLSIAIFIFLWNRDPLLLSFNYWLSFFVGIVMFLFIAFAFKYLVHRCLGGMNIPFGTKEWTVSYLRTNELLGIVSFIPALFLIYVNNYINVLFATLLMLFLASRLIIFWNLLSIFVKNKMGFLYFIVYLCGVEIVPYILLYKGAVFFIKILANIGV